MSAHACMDVKASAADEIRRQSGSGGPVGVARVLVAIANHGEKNRRFLERLVAEYQSMVRYQVDIVVLSDAPKVVGPGIEVRVGLPSADPWSLPFGYKALFNERADDYDYYIYSEDDTLLRESNLDAFVEVTRLLPDDCIAGFLRYEVGEDGSRYYSSMHSHYHWDPRQVWRLGDSVFGYYTNEHAAIFILTREQLHRAIASGGFLLPPRRGRYDMLVTAATDPYTVCGMKKVICISRLDDFCLHHLPNAYCGKLGLHEDQGRLEIATLIALAGRGADNVDGPLIEQAELPDGHRWNKSYHEACRADVLGAVPPGVESVLSIGCGSGETEAALVQAGVKVVAIPLDSVIGQIAMSKGIDILAADFEAAERDLADRRFDCILIIDILPHITAPCGLLARYRQFLAPGGCMIVALPNWDFHRTLIARIRGFLGMGPAPMAGDAKVHRSTRRTARAWLHAVGFVRIDDCSTAGPRWESLRRRCGLACVGTCLCRNMVFRADAG